MNLNLNDPDSIVAWWRVYPARHWAYLEYYAAHAQAQFQPAIRLAQRRIAADPLFASVLNGIPVPAAGGARLRPGEMAVDETAGAARADDGDASPAWEPLRLAA
jgi:hypothetical protein